MAIRRLPPRWQLKPTLSLAKSNPMTMSLGLFPKSNDWYSGALRFCLALALVLAGSRMIAQNCNPDVSPPIAVCNASLDISIGASGQAEIFAPDVDEGSYDACCLDTILIRRWVDGPCDSDNLDDDFTGSVAFCCADAGNSIVVQMRVYDCSGNTNECWMEVNVADKTKPVCQAPPDVTVVCENFDPTLNAYGVAQGTDNCCIDTIIQSLNYAQFDSLCSKGTITRTFKVYDCGGEFSQCTQQIVSSYQQEYFIRFPNDVIATVYTGNLDNFGQPVFFGEDCELLATSFEDVVFLNVPDADKRIERTWSIINWCTYNPNLDFVSVPNPMPNADENHPANLPGPTVSLPGTPIPWQSTIVKILPDDPAPTNFSTFYDPNANGYRYTQIIKVNIVPTAALTGTVFSDTVSNCVFDAGEPLLSGWTVKVTGLVTGSVYTTNTNSAGVYNIAVPANDTTAEITLTAPFNFGQDCPSVYTVNPVSGQTIVQDIPVYLETSCPLLSVDLSAPFLRRCFQNTYTVRACNLSEAGIPDVSVEVAFDQYLSYNYSSVPGVLLGNNTYSFDLDTLAAGECRTFYVNLDVDCAAPPGYTHCSTAHVFPDTICPAPPGWSGADVEVSGYCDGDSVRFVIENIGAGNMNEILGFVVVEDIIMVQSDDFQLDAGQSQYVVVPANGATWRLEAGEASNRPWGGVEAVAVEGCGGLNTTGLVTLFPLNTSDPFETTDCQENIGSYDPNDKRAYPGGYGSEHLIDANTGIDYIVRFQNTGTDTAFSVVVMDTLSPFLDARAVRPGAASHPYEFAVLDGNVLRFRFDHILLPDSTINEAGSHGFIKFWAPQAANNSVGTRIENQAAIYFDFNEPVLTNTTFHTIGDHFVLVNAVDIPGATADVRLHPNPTTGTLYLEVGYPADQADFILTDPYGKIQRLEQFSGWGCRIERRALPAGLYFYTVRQNGQTIGSGKILYK